MFLDPRRYGLVEDVRRFDIHRMARVRLYHPEVRYVGHREFIIRLEPFLGGATNQ